jgi:hypothetical protein
VRSPACGFATALQIANAGIDDVFLKNRSACGFATALQIAKPQAADNASPAISLIAVINLKSHEADTATGSRHYRLEYDKRR